MAVQRSEYAFVRECDAKGPGLRRANCFKGSLQLRFRTLLGSIKSYRYVVGKLGYRSAISFICGTECD